VRRNFKSDLKEALIIITVVSFFALLFNQFRLNQLPLAGEWLNKPHNARLLKISIDEVKKELEEGKAFFLDIRSRIKYQEGHIPKSFNLPYDYFYELLPAVKKQILPTMRIITYGEDNEYFFSADSAVLLMDAGFKDVRVFFDGWSQWKKSGLPIEKD